MEDHQFQLKKGTLTVRKDRLEIQDNAKLLKWLFLIQSVLFFVFAVHFLQSYQSSGNGFDLILAITCAFTAVTSGFLLGRRSAKKEILYSDVRQVKIKRDFMGNAMVRVLMNQGSTRFIAMVNYRDQMRLLHSRLMALNVNVAS